MMTTGKTAKDEPIPPAKIGRPSNEDIAQRERSEEFEMDFAEATGLIRSALGGGAGLPGAAMASITDHDHWYLGKLEKEKLGVAIELWLKHRFSFDWMEDRHKIFDYTLFFLFAFAYFPRAIMEITTRVKEKRKRGASDPGQKKDGKNNARKGDSSWPPKTLYSGPKGGAQRGPDRT